MQPTLLRLVFWRLWTVNKLGGTLPHVSAWLEERLGFAGLFADILLRGLGQVRATDPCVTDPCVTHPCVTDPCACLPPA